MRYDDTLETVLASDLSTPFGKQSAWRQLVDLIGRRRVVADSRAISVLRTIRDDVPLAVRAASARGLEYADPPPSLVRLLVHDDIAVAGPVLRSARLTSGEWILMLPELKPGGRAILRHRRDLSPLVQRALESFGSSDLALTDGTIAEESIEAANEAMPAIGAEAHEVQPSAIEAEPAIVADRGVFAGVDPAIALDSAGAEALFDAQQESLGATDQQVPPEIVPVAEPADGEPAEPPVESPAVPVSAGPDAIASFVPMHWFGALPTDSVQRMAMPLASQVEIAQERPAEVAGHGASGPISQPDAEALAAPSVGGETMQAPAPAHPAEAAPQTEVSREPVGQSQALPAETQEPTPEAPDFSFVELALAGFAAASVAPGGQATHATNGVGASDQSGTNATPGHPETVAAEAGQAQESTMFEGVDVRDGLREPVAGAPGPGIIVATEAGTSGEYSPGPFQIAEVVARIDAFYRNREEGGALDASVADLPRSEVFRFETDSKGVIRWVEGVARAPVIGLSLDLQGMPGGSRVDGQATGAFRRRAGFTNARLEIEGESDAAGAWLISAIPVFDPGNGRFAGYRGTARRPRSDERAEPVAKSRPALAADSLRQLVHELRTPTNAIAGFAEMIESEMLGPVTDSYRDRARTIRVQARDLLGAIDDLDLAARIESAALALTPDRIVLRPLLASITDDLTPLMALRGSWIALPVDDLAVNGDRRAVERLLSRLMATLVSASGEGERIGVRLTQDTDRMVTITIDRPRALADYPGEAVLGIDDEGGDATLLGTGFALRLARNLARELGGSMVIEPESLTLQLPAPDNQPVEHAHLN